MQDNINNLAAILSSVPAIWNGKDAILEMRNNGYPHWKQNEWVGFYFQYLCDKYLPNAGMKVPGTEFGRSKFDGNLGIDWDFKAHSIHNKNGKKVDDLIVNDMEATVATIKANGRTGLIVTQGEAIFDDDAMSFRKWHTELKGGPSKYSLENMVRGASKRKYKTAFTVKHIDIYLIDGSDLEKQGSFQKGMRNSNGKPRREKLKIDLATLIPIKTITL